MPLAIFEVACVIVVLLTLATMARARGPSTLLRDYALLAVAGFVGEETCIAAYRFYAYAPGWHLRLFDVPLLVPLIWPLVVLSARDVAAVLFPERPRALVVAALVAIDASLVEVVAVRAGLWSWREPGHLSVPIIGILGWAYFAFGASLALDRKPALAVALGPATAHALILATWWGLFRWTLRGALGTASIVAVVLLASIACFFVLDARRRGRAIPLAIAAPRMIAAGLFVALLVSTAGSDEALWTHTAAVAVPYLVATSWIRGTRSAEAPREATARSPG